MHLLFHSKHNKNPLNFNKINLYGYFLTAHTQIHSLMDTHRQLTTPILKTILIAKNSHKLASI